MSIPINNRAGKFAGTIQVWGAPLTEDALYSRGGVDEFRDDSEWWGVP